MSRSPEGGDRPGTLAEAMAASAPEAEREKVQAGLERAEAGLERLGTWASLILTLLAVPFLLLIVLVQVVATLDGGDESDLPQFLGGLLGLGIVLWALAHLVVGRSPRRPWFLAKAATALAMLVLLFLGIGFLGEGFERLETGLFGDTVSGVILTGLGLLCLWPLRLIADTREGGLSGVVRFWRGLAWPLRTGGRVRLSRRDARTGTEIGMDGDGGGNGD